MFDKHYIKIGFNIGIGIALALLALVAAGFALHLLLVIGIFSMNSGSGGIIGMAVLAFATVISLLLGLVGMQRLLRGPSDKIS